MERKQPGIEEFVGIIGTDNQSPVYEPHVFRKRCHDYDDVYWGTEGENKIVPNVGDWIRTFEGGEDYIVVSIDPITFIADIKALTNKGGNSIDAILSFTEQNFVAMFNDSVRPFTLSIDPTLKTHIDEAIAYRIYRGTVLAESNVISQQFNNTGNVIGTDIPLELSAIDEYQNNSIKGFPSCNTNRILKNGEAISVVVFGSSGNMLGKYHLIVMESNYVKPAYSKSKLVTNIFLKTSLIHPSQPGIVRFPANLTTESFMPVGVVQYSDGTQTEYVCDGTKMELHGVGSISRRPGRGPLSDSFTSAIIGMKVPLELVYNKSKDEGVLMNVGVQDNRVVKPYELVISETKRSWGVKLFSYPEWVGELEGYRLRHYLLNLDRSELYDVTRFVSLAVNSDPFYSKAWGTTQRLTFMIELSESGMTFGKPGDAPNYNAFIHTQTMDVLLRAPATEDFNRNIWEVKSISSTATPYYGTELRATIFGKENQAVNIGNSFATLKDFLDETYYKTDPLVDELEPIPLVPTDIMITYRGVTRAIPVAKYNEAIDFGIDVHQYENVTISFVRRTTGLQGDIKYLYLSVIEMTIRS